MSIAKMEETAKNVDPKFSGNSQPGVILDAPIPIEEPATRALDVTASEAFWPDSGLNEVVLLIDHTDTNHLREVECLEMLFYLGSRRSDARCLAEVAIETYGSIARVFQRPGTELREILGIDHAATALLGIAKSCMKFILAPESPYSHEVRSCADLMRYLALDMRGTDQEIFRIVYFDKDGRIIRDEELARGTVDAVTVYPREVTKRALACCASSVVLAHNHLSDDPTPSPSDVRATIKMKAALQLFDIVLHDHIIIARSRSLSMQERCLI